ncbi:MAG: zinc ribbon domain-containing protein [Deltaproteobacteria bacterium]|nr:zinc ribbon domain-containing protein [Deltaproteobacteria bacterium]
MARCPQRRWAFIFIGGVQPRKVQVDDQPRTCPNCGFPSVRLKRLDHYLSLFFIPLIPVKRGEIFMECDHCGGIFGETGKPQPSPFRHVPFRMCPSCGRQMETKFKFCPYCGQKVS